MSYQILDRIRITDDRVDTSSISSLMEFNIFVSASLIDPFKNKMIKINNLSCTVNRTEKIGKFIDHFKAFNGLNQFNLRLIYNHKLYDEHLTFGEIHIKNHAQIELVSLQSEKVATENEGFIFTFWSLCPLMIAASFIIAGLGGRFDYLVRGIYVLVGTVFFIPSFLLLIIGISQKYTKEMHTAFVNHEWFGRCGKCKCCSKGDEVDTDSEDIEILMQRDQEVPIL
ncbi:hypothetical protein M9Y10_003811 [Tritrichomonas musculus]|uniref:Uncharacterized protein n=1 Tax=Tritrichomonas musculus TaxID=1915356 RepID=A0ABR2JR35_9EUKA